MLKEPLDIWYLHATVTRADTHVYWHARSVARHRSGRETTEHFLDSSVTDLDVFLDLIRRGVIGKAERVEGEELFFHESAWRAIADQVEHRHREPDGRDTGGFWYQITVHGIGHNRVVFDWSLFGYKYSWRGVELDRDVFYELADRLDARVRFASDWAAIEESAAELSALLPHSPNLASHREQLQHLLGSIKAPSPQVYESAAADAFRCLEGVLRGAAERGAWKGGKRNLATLLQLLEREISPSGEDLELLRFSKPLRDYLQHGHRPGLHMSKIALVTALQCLVRAANMLDMNQGERRHSRPG